MDAAQALHTFLNESDEAAPIREALQGDVLEAGDLTSAMLKGYFASRTDMNKALCVTVHCGPERRVAQDEFARYVTVGIYDMQRGYHNLRKVRTLLRDIVDSYVEVLPLTDQSGRRMGIIALSYAESTGYLHSKPFVADFEAITYIAREIREEI